MSPLTTDMAKVDASPRGHVESSSETAQGVPEMTCLPSVDDRTCSIEDSCGFKLPGFSCNNVMEDKAGRKSNGDCQSVETDGSALETVLLKTSKRPGSGKSSNRRNSNPNSVVEEDQMLTRAQERAQEKIPECGHFNPSPATAEQDCSLPLQQAMTEECVCTDAPVLILPTDMVDQPVGESMPVHPAPSTANVARAFVTNSGKGSKPPGSGQPSPRHNSIPGSMTLKEALHTSVESKSGQSMQVHPTPSTATDEVARAFVTNSGKGSKPPGSGQPSPRHNSIPDSTLLKEALHSRVESKSGAGAFVRIDSSNLQNMLARKSGLPGSGDSSSKHNSVPDRLASE